MNPRPPPNWKFVSCASCFARCTSSAGRESLSAGVTSTSTGRWPISSRARFTKSLYPRLPGSYSVIGWPKLAASFSLVLKLTVLSIRYSRNFARSSLSTSRASFVRVSYSVGSTRMTTSFAHRSRSISSVSIIFVSPCRLKYPVSTGTITSSQARSALNVSSPTLGGQSMMHQP
jgi:hypothetical protein